MNIKKGDKIVCISPDSEYLTNGKQYIVLESFSDMGVAINDDRNIYDMYRITLFCKLNVYRSDIINSILD